MARPAASAIEIAALYPPNREHFMAMMSPLGICQFARGRTPDPDGGTCSDDVARSLVVDILHARILGWPVVEPSARTSLRYLVDALDPDTGRARNQRAYDGTWRAGEDSEDCHGRVMLALAQATRHLPRKELRGTARAAFTQASACAWDLSKSRAIASSLLACAALSASERPMGLLEHLGDRLASIFAGAADDRWPWPDDTVTYESALPPRALVVAGRMLSRPTVSRIGLTCLDWLFRAQTTEDGIFEPIGNREWWKRGSAKGRFAQQPIEAASVILAAGDALELTGDLKYAAMAERAYAWFLGANSLGVRVAEPERGACRDGLEEAGANENQGAESTLMWLTGVERMRRVREWSIRSTATALQLPPTEPLRG